MAEEVAHETDQSEAISKRNPHDIIGIAGIIRAHSKDVEAKKLRVRMENENYMIAHPEINILISLFMKSVLDEHPDDILQFAGVFFDRPNLKELVRWELEQDMNIQSTDSADVPPEYNSPEMS